VTAQQVASGKNLTGTTAIVTGATAGIGRETARQLANAGAHVILPCRDRARGVAAMKEIEESLSACKGTLEVMELDLQSFDSVRAFSAALEKKKAALNLLVCNAGMWASERQLIDGIDVDLYVNHFAHFLLFHGVLPSLQRAKNSRVVVLSSALHANAKALQWETDLMAKGDWAHAKAYAQSKLANVLFAKGIQRRHARDGVTAVAVHPGITSTGLIANLSPVIQFLVKFVASDRSVEQAAATTLHCCVADKLTGGCYYEDCHESTPSPAAQVEAEGDRLWKHSEAVCGLVS